jgi:hypothetical protein
MNSLHANLEIALKTAALLQIGIAILNLFLVRMMHWKGELDRLPRLVQEVFHVHSWFISVTLALFAVITLRFSGEMAGGADAACRWLAGGIGIFWGFRTVLQVGYYTASHWRGQAGRTVIHVILLLMYGGFAFAYLCAAFGTNR